LGGRRRKSGKRGERIRREKFKLEMITLRVEEKVRKSSMVGQGGAYSILRDRSEMKEKDIRNRL